MAEYDGSIIIDTEIDTQGIGAGSKEMKAAIRSLNSSVNQLGGRMEKAMQGGGSAMAKAGQKAAEYESALQRLEEEAARLEQAMLAAGRTQTPTDEYKWVTQEIEKAEKAMERLTERQNKMDATGVKKNSAAYQRLQYDIDAAKKKLDDLRATQQIYENTGTAYTPGSTLPEFQKAAATLEQIRAKIAEIRATASQAVTPLGKLTTIANGLRSAFAAAGDAIKKAFGGAWKYAKKAANALLGVVQRIGASFGNLALNLGKAVTGINLFGKKARSAGGGFAGSLKSIMKYGFGIRTLYVLTNRLRTALVSGFENLAQYSDSTNRSISSVSSALEQLKNSLATAFSPILSVVAPILTTLINLLSTAITYIGMFFAALTGAKSFTKAIGVQKDYAGALGGTAGAAKEAAEEVKEASRQLASFDELNILTDDRSKDKDTSSGGGGGGAANMFEEVPIESAILDFVERIKQLFRDGDYEEIGRIIGEGINRAFQKVHDFIAWDNLGATLTKYIDAFCRIFNSMVDTIDWDLIGSTFAEGVNTIVNSAYLLFTGIDWVNLGKSFSEGLNGFIRDVDWEKFGKTIGEFFKLRLEVLYGAVEEFDWASLGKAMADGINGIFSSFDFGMLGQTFSDFAIGLLTFATTAIAETDWQQIGSFIREGLENIDWQGIAYSLGQLVGAVVRAAIEFAVGLLGDLWSIISEWWDEQVQIAEERAAESGCTVGEMLIGGILEGLVEAIAGIGSWLWKNIGEPIVEGFKDMFGIHSPSTVMAEIGVYLIEGLLQGIRETWGNIVAYLSTAASGIKATLVGKWNEIKTSVTNTCQSIYSNVKSKFESTAAVLRSKVDDMKNKARTGFEEMKTKVSTAAQSIYSTIRDKFSTAASTISQKVGSMQTSVASAFESIRNSITSKLQAAFDYIAGIDWGSIGQKITSGIQNGVSYVKNVGSSIVQAGTNIMQGIGNGIKNGYNTVKNAAVGAANTIVKTFTSQLDINSPSRVMEDKVGFMSGLGVAVGLEKSTGVVMKTVSAMADRISEEMAGSETVVPMRVEATESGLDASLTSFADRVSDSFTQLMERLSAIAGSVSFRVPAIATGGIAPYSVTAKASGSDSLSESLSAANDGLSSVIIQSVTNATAAIVDAIEQYSGTTVNLDADSLTTKVIEEINRRTRMTGKSPILT